MKNSDYPNWRRGLICGLIAGFILTVLFIFLFIIAGISKEKTEGLDIIFPAIKFFLINFSAFTLLGAFRPNKN